MSGMQPEEGNLTEFEERSMLLAAVCCSEEQGKMP